MTAAVPSPGELVLLAGAVAHVAHGLVTTPVNGLAPAGAGTTSAGADATAPTVSAGHLLLQLVLGLGVVVGLVMLAQRLLRGRTGGGLVGQGGGRRSPVKVLGRHALGKGVSVAVVQFGDEAYLVGVTPQSVRKLAVTDAASLVEDDGAVAPRRALAARLAVAAGGGPARQPLARALERLSPALAARLPQPKPGAAPAGSEGPATHATVLDLVPVTGSGRARITHTAGDGPARTTTRRGARPAPTWTSAIEHLRERTVRRA